MRVGPRRRKLSVYPTVEVVNADFETWKPSHGEFDAAISFTAFHWIDPELRYERSASVLRLGGALAVVGTKHVLTEGGDQFFADVQEDSLAATGEIDGSPPPHPESVPDLGDEINASCLFRNVAVRRYIWDVTSTADEYIAVLDTYSGHRALDVIARERLYTRVRRRIEARPEGTVRKTYLATLNVAQRVEPRTSSL